MQVTNPILLGVFSNVNPMWIIIGVAVFVGILIIRKIIKFRDGCIDFETRIEAADKAEEIAYNKGLQIVKGNRQAEELYIKGIKTVIDAQMKGRYGADGQKAAISMLTEDNQGFDNSVYETLQRAIQSLFNELGGRQQSKNDIVRAYKFYYESTINALINNICFGNQFPRIDIAFFEEAVTTESVKEQYDTRTMKDFNLND